jgi:hypothetical protein
MTHIDRDTRRTTRLALLGGAAALALAFGAPALAQPQPQGQQAQPQTPGQQQAQQPQPSQQTQPGQLAPSQQAGSQQPAVMGQLRTAEQSLRQAQQQLSGGQDANIPQARTAVSAGMAAIGRVPNDVQQREAFRTAREQLTEANQALQGQQPNGRQAAERLGEAADALASLVQQMGGTAAATQAGGQQAAQAGGQQTGQASGQQAGATQSGQAGAGSGPQIAVQQPAPQVTVQQPAPRITVEQPQPQVTVRQAEPQVTVRQAEPQVTVQRQGEPQVTVQRQGEAQVTQQRPPAAGQADQRTGATATPAPAQSAGSRPQTTATSPAAGVPLASVERLIGTNVYGADGRQAGEVRNLLMDGNGQVRAAVIEWGGFLGIGEKEALVPIERLQLGSGNNDRVTMTITRQELEALPRYDRSRVADYGREQGWGEGLRLHR